MPRPFLAVALALGASCVPLHHARADTNATSIAVPLIGTQGTAAPYPSRQVVTARPGPATLATVRLALHGVTHPCPEDLAILLVRNGTEKYLLMSNAGGCRPLQGTRITFSPGGTVLADTQPPTPAHGALLEIGPSNYGTPPVFPAPAPPGPYTPGMPPNPSLVEGTWDLYVMDTGSTGRGVISGGWSLFYRTEIERTSPLANVFLPSFGTQGTAAAYPITFDLRDIPADVRVARVSAAIALSHTHPDDIQLALQSPSGTTVVLMANAGGSVDLAPGSVLRFTDLASSRVLDDGPVATGSYKPTAYPPIALGPSAPPGPYQADLNALDGEPARGVWRLWAFDDAPGDAGLIASATLRMDTEVGPDMRVAVPPTSSTQPFVRLRGIDVAISPHARHWRVTNGGTFYDAGAFSPDPETPNGFVADIPVKQGVNRIIYTSINTGGASSETTQDVTVNEFTYSFAEGATGGFFDLDLTMANPTGTAAPIRMDFLPEGGAPIPVNETIAGDTALQFSVDGVVNGAVSSVVHSSSAVPLAAERTMIWDTTGYGGHGGTAVAPATQWFFAEGSQGFFDTFILLANDNAADATVLLEFLVEGGGVVTVPLTVPAKARRTVFAGNVPELVNRSFSLAVDSSRPIIAERAMYLPGPRVFEGGHESAGVNSPSRVWFLAEGATGSFFDCFVLLGNPNAGPATATMTYLLPSGSTIVRTVTIPAKSRLTINVETVDPALANADVSTTIVSDIGIVAERAMYWPAFSQGWREAHNSFGVTESALRWGLADGRIGGPRAFQTFVLLANPNPRPAEVEVRFLKAGSGATRSYVLAPLSRRSIFVNSEVPELGDGQFSVDVQVRNFQPIAVEKALYWNSGGEVFAGGTNVTATRLPPP
jgi:subtilisin-like proprotein convertase family protein